MQYLKYKKLALFLGFLAIIPGQCLGMAGQGNLSTQPAPRGIPFSDLGRASLSALQAGVSGPQRYPSEVVPFNQKGAYKAFTGYWITQLLSGIFTKQLKPSSVPAQIMTSTLAGASVASIYNHAPKSLWETGSTFASIFKYSLIFQGIGYLVNSAFSSILPQAITTNWWLSWPLSWLADGLTSHALYSLVG